MKGKRFLISTLLAGVLVLVAVASCQPVSNYLPSDSIPAGTNASSAPGSKPIPTGASSYGRSTLPNDELKEAYDGLSAAITNCDETAELPAVTAEELTQVMTCVRRDHPLETWLASEYSFETSSIQPRTTVHLSYIKEKTAVIEERKEIAAASKKLLDNIDASLSDFDKAVILYDRLCEHVVYDLNAPNRDEVVGAVIDGRAACQGYAKAYQYLLSRMGIEALIVYGTAGDGAHAWNIVRLDGDYYLADPTWGDAMLDNGTAFISHEFLLRDGVSFGKTHQPLTDGTNYPLPNCDKTDQSYFVKSGTAISSMTDKELTKKLAAALNSAAANRYTAVQVCFLEPLTAEEIEHEVIADGRLDQIFHTLSARRGIKALGRSFKGDTLTYLIRYEN